MLKQTITYTDYNDTVRTEDFYFNLSKSDIVALETSIDGGLYKSLENIVRSNDGNAIIREFRKIVHSAYGKKSDDGKRFMKSEEISKEFEETPAYDQFFMELVTDVDKALAFVKAILPKDMAAEIEAKEKAGELQIK